MTAATITDTRLDTITHAREVLDRARNQGIYQGSPRILTAMTDLDRALKTGTGTGTATGILIAAIASIRGDDAAAYVNDTSELEGEWAA